MIDFTNNMLFEFHIHVLITRRQEPTQCMPHPLFTAILALLFLINLVSSRALTAKQLRLHIQPMSLGHKTSASVAVFVTITDGFTRLRCKYFATNLQSTLHALQPYQ